MQKKPSVEPIPYLSSNSVTIHTLRLDQVHPIVSGNKWYKLRYYLQSAKDSDADIIASFGGPYSNHLVALAYAAKEKGLKSIGYIRSNEGEPITPSIQEALNFNMQIVHLGRSNFEEKKNELLQFNKFETTKIYYVNEGGYGLLGAKGASTILNDWSNSVTNINTNPKIELQDYNYIICAVGTGTMIAGIINAKYRHQTAIGIPVLKNEGSIKEEIINLLEDKNSNFELLHSFHQGGYAKTSPKQIEFMNHLWAQAKIPTDIVYTGKLFYAVEQLVQQNYFKPNSKVLVIHSGGLQGNRSLTKGILQF